MPVSCQLLHYYVNTKIETVISELLSWYDADEETGLDLGFWIGGLVSLSINHFQRYFIYGKILANYFRNWLYLVLDI